MSLEDEDAIFVTKEHVTAARKRYDALDWSRPELAAGRNPRTARYARASAMAGILASVMGYSVEEALALYVANDMWQALVLSLTDGIEREKAAKAALS